MPDGKFSFLVAAANYEDGVAGGAAIREYREGGAADLLAATPSSVGPLALADVDGDGALDLFVGGRVVAGRYPQPASSTLLLQSNGKFVPDPANSGVLTNIGMVSAAVFTDLNGDGAPDLALACEWGSLRVFRNEKGRLVDATTALGLEKHRGLWTSIAAGDFDGDGRVDLVAGNWGENTKFESHRSRPLRLYYGDFDGNGIVEVVESYFDPVSGNYVPARQLDSMARGMPWLQHRFPTWESFSRASVDDLLGDMAKAHLVEANWLATTVFLNRGDHFEAVRLPDEAQWAPVFGVCVADFDGDGNEDIFLAQNFFGTSADTSRYDAGRGLLLRGDGTGRFKPVPGQESGITIYGEQRGAAVADFDGDGRADLAVAQNGAETKLYRNNRAAPGLRIRLAGPPGNATAIGAILRIGDGTKWSPAREIHAGGGYWSQDSATQVLARRGDHLSVRWPGRRQTDSIIPSGAREIVVDSTGAVKVIR